MPGDPRRERYWDGRQWLMSQTGNVTARAQPVPDEMPRVNDPQQARAAATNQSSGLSTLGGLCYFIAVLIAVGAAIGGLALINHKICGVNPYNTSLSDCDSTFSTHPNRTAGIATIIGGLVQALVVAFVGYLVFELGKLRSTMTAA